MPMSGVDLIRAEVYRMRQSEGFTPDLDAGRTGELALAAASYATQVAWPHRTGTPNLWPWAGQHWKPKTPKRDLIRAGALIAAAIESLED